MAGITEIRNRIKSIQQTLKITNAMYMISSSKLKKARRQLTDVQPYFQKIAQTIGDILRHSPEMKHVYLDGHEKAEAEKQTAVIVVTGDKGMAGAYNHNVLKLAEQVLSEKSNPTLFLIGEVGRHHFNKKNIQIDAEFMYTAQDPVIQRAREISDTFIGLYRRGRIDELYIVFTWPVSPIQTEATVAKLLPLDMEMLRSMQEEGLAPDTGTPTEVFTYTPSPSAVLDKLVPGVLKGFLFGALVESFCSEQSARMTAMDAASKNAQDMLKRLSLEYNRARQAAITQEITEISGGAEGLRQA
ncbi:MAG: ATP synthase F1 subunit gamma [Clostridia bacterium]|nr:ATP synthase F1 subunit gamma [Clostridia bacterium]